jgi:hypothetical protein
MNVGKGLAYKMEKKMPYNLENSEYIFDFGNLIVILSFPHFCFVLSCNYGKYTTSQAHNKYMSNKKCIFSI